MKFKNVTTGLRNNSAVIIVFLLCIFLQLLTFSSISYLSSSVRDLNGMVLENSRAIATNQVCCNRLMNRVEDLE